MTIEPDLRDSRRLADEQAALRRVSTLVAGRATGEELFAGVAREVAQLLGVTMVTIDRYEREEGSTTVVASVDDPGFPVGSRWPLDGPSLAATVIETGQPARVDDYSGVESSSAAAARAWGVGSTVGVPIVVDGAVWGVVCVGTESAPLPDDTEERLGGFTELIATAIANMEARESRRELLEEQAALRRVATRVAESASPAEVFLAVATEIVQLFDLAAVSISRYEGDMCVVVADPQESGFPVGSRWSLEGDSLAARVLATGATARIDDYEDLPGVTAEAMRASPSTSAVGIPIVVDGSIWGVLCVGAPSPQDLPPDTAARVAGFTELVATAISNSEAHEILRAVVDQQAALRRVATRVAEGASAPEVAAVVAEEVGRVLGVPGVSLDRYDSDGSTTVIAAWGEIPFPVGTRWPVEPGTVAHAVLETAGPSRLNHYLAVEGSVADALRDSYPDACIVGAPIVVDGHVWGMIGVGMPAPGVLPAGTETRLTEFTELVATAISNTAARDRLHTLADEQAALRRVATLVARGTATDELVAAVCEEVSRVVGMPLVTLDRFDQDGTFTTVLGSWQPEGEPVWPVGSRWPFDGPSVAKQIWETGRPAHRADYRGLSGSIAKHYGDTPQAWAIGVPIVVDNHVWGMIGVGSPTMDVAPPDAEARLAGFTELVATAISNAEARDRVRGLAEEQAALHRVAALVAQGTDTAVLFDAVCEEAGMLVGAASVNLSRYTPDGINVTMAGWGLRDTHVPAGARYPTSGIRSSLSAPVVVEGELWGALVAATDRDEPLPPGTEVRLAHFTELIATAISNATTRAQLITSRARIVAAGDEARRRIERNLHDGTQQQLIALGLELQAVRATVPQELGEAHEGLVRMSHEIDAVLEDVRDLSRGLHPSLLARAGLAPSLRSLGRRSPIPVLFSVQTGERPPEPVETCVYFVVSEALTNAIKYSQAAEISVDVSWTATSLKATVDDDGVGGARAERGSGLTGLIDRVEALGGRLVVRSPSGEGTSISAELPLTTGG